MGAGNAGCGGHEEGPSSRTAWLWPWLLSSSLPPDSAWFCGRGRAVSAAGARFLTSWSTQPLPSGSLKVA